MTARVVVETPRSRWSEGKVFGLGDPLGRAWIRGKRLDDWRAGAQVAPSEVTGPALVYGADTFATPSMEQALTAAGASQSGAVRLARAPSGAGGLADPLGRLPRDSVGRILFDLWYIPNGVTASVQGDDPLVDASPMDVDVRTRTFDVPADPEVSGGDTLSLTFAGASCGPVGHWVEVMRMNLLTTGGQLLEVPKGAALRRYLWAGLKAGSLKPDYAFAKLNRIHPTARVHPSAIVEISTVGEGARIGPGAIVRSSWIGPGAKVGSQALCELATVGEGAQVQRKAMVVVATVYPKARCGGIVQFGLSGEASTQKMFAVGTDMKLDGKVKTLTPDGFRDVDVGYLGVGFGHRSFVGSGVWIAPGRFVPNDCRIARPVDLMVLKPGEGR